MPVPIFIVSPSSSSSSAIVDNLAFSSSVTASFLFPRFLDFELLTINKQLTMVFRSSHQLLEQDLNQTKHLEYTG